MVGPGGRYPLRCRSAGMTLFGVKRSSKRAWFSESEGGIFLFRLEGAGCPPTMLVMTRHDGRLFDQLRPIQFEAGFAPHATGSVLCSFGNTRVICSAMVQEDVPRWMKAQNVKGGWITAEYSMLPYSTLDRKMRDIHKGKLDGRSVEIQRLIGRSLRTMLDLEKLGQRTLWIDCDVLQADGGTRTASITGASVAIGLAVNKLIAEGLITANPILHQVAAVSCGIVEETPLLDLNYVEDKDAAVDMNVVMTSSGEFVEIQGSGEEATFTEDQLTSLLALGRSGIRELHELQTKAIEAASIA